MRVGSVGGRGYPLMIVFVSFGLVQEDLNPRSPDSPIRAGFPHHSIEFFSVNNLDFYILLRSYFQQNVHTYFRQSSDMRTLVDIW